MPLTDRRWSDAIKFLISKTVIHQIDDYYYSNYDSTTKITFTSFDSYMKCVDRLKMKTFDEYSNILKTCMLGRI